MGTLRKIKNIAIDTIDFVSKVSKTLNETDYKRQGHEFEKYVANIFTTQSPFTIINWTHDQDHKHDGVMVESDKEPDLKIRYKPTGEEFFVECKFRGHLLSDNKLEWCSEYSLKKYQKFSQQHPVFVVIGLGGESTSPNRMFCIPLTEARWTQLFPSVYLKYERHPPDKKFFWRNGILS